MPSNRTRISLEREGVFPYKGEASRYDKFDSLANASDLEALFETLTRFKDNRGKHPVFTAVSLVANPDFEAIESDQFRHYYYEPVTKTLERYGYNDVRQLWKEGEQKGVFYPEFHGREHLNVAAWMRALQSGDRNTRKAFKHGCWGIVPRKFSYQAAFDLESKNDLAMQHEIIISGLRLFEELHGRKARFFVPPNGPFNNSLQSTAANGGVEYLSTAKLQHEPIGGGETRRRLHYLGQKSKYGLTYLTRNCSFEPSSPGRDWVDSCLADINNAFRMNKPAVVSTHRVNYIGALNTLNRENGHDQLNRLLEKILSNWSDTLFLTSSELGDLVSRKKDIDELVE